MDAFRGFKPAVKCSRSRTLKLGLLDNQLITDLIKATVLLLEKVAVLGPIAS